MNKIIPAPGKENNYVSLERLTFLVDGIFAITITLLVLDLRLPETNNLDLLQGLRDMLPRLFIYFIAFYSIASHWIIHQRLFRYITGVDATMIWLMMLELLFITLIPVSTAIVGRFPTAGLALGLFSANGFLHAITNCIFCAYAARNQKQFAVHTDPRRAGDPFTSMASDQRRLPAIDPARLFECIYRRRILDPSACPCSGLGKHQARLVDPENKLNMEEQ